jgi:hypothetical protein
MTSRIRAILAALLGPAVLLLEITMRTRLYGVHILIAGYVMAHLMFWPPALAAICVGRYFKFNSTLQLALLMAIFSGVLSFALGGLFVYLHLAPSGWHGVLSDSADLVIAGAGALIVYRVILGGSGAGMRVPLTTAGVVAALLLTGAAFALFKSHLFASTARADQGRFRAARVVVLARVDPRPRLITGPPRPSEPPTSEFLVLRSWKGPFPVGYQVEAVCGGECGLLPIQAIQAGSGHLVVLYSLGDVEPIDPVRLDVVDEVHFEEIARELDALAVKTGVVPAESTGDVASTDHQLKPEGAQLTLGDALHIADEMWASIGGLAIFKPSRFYYSREQKQGFQTAERKESCIWVFTYVGTPSVWDGRPSQLRRILEVQVDDRAKRAGVVVDHHYWD